MVSATNNSGASRRGTATERGVLPSTRGRQRLFAKPSVRWAAASTKRSRLRVMTLSYTGYRSGFPSQLHQLNYHFYLRYHERSSAIPRARSPRSHEHPSAMTRADRSALRETTRKGANPSPIPRATLRDNTRRSPLPAGSAGTSPEHDANRLVLSRMTGSESSWNRERPPSARGNAEETARELAPGRRHTRMRPKSSCFRGEKGASCG